MLSRKSIITSSRVCPWHLCDVKAYAILNGNCDLWYVILPERGANCLFCFSIGTALLLCGLWSFNRNFLSCRSLLPILSSLKTTHTTSGKSGFSLLGWILSMYPRAPLFIPSSLYFASEWLQVITTGAFRLRIRFEVSCPSSFPDLVFPWFGCFLKFVALSVAIASYCFSLGKSFDSFSLLISSFFLFVVTIIDSFPCLKLSLFNSLGISVLITLLLR